MVTNAIARSFINISQRYKALNLFIMPEPFLCTNNTLGNIDYGVPIVANKSTDYRTSTGLYHRLIPNVAQEFDCRAKAKIKPKLNVTDVTIRDDNISSTYSTGFKEKFPSRNALTDLTQPSRCSEVYHLRTFQEKLFKKPPPPKSAFVSEAKEQYVRKFRASDDREVYPPEPYAQCKVQGLGRDEQPGVRPEEKGYWKWMDPYLSTARSSYVPFTKDQWNGVARKDVVTFYDISNLPKVKGFGPRNGPTAEPLISKRKTPMFDKIPFKVHPSDRRVREVVKRVPNFGRTTEFKSNYVKQSFSDMYPYLFQNGVEFPESLPKSSPWQDWAPPGMYCTEYCHTGSGWPVNSIIDYGLPEEHVVHKPCYTKFHDWSQ